MKDSATSPEHVHEGEYYSADKAIWMDTQPGTQIYRQYDRQTDRRAQLMRLDITHQKTLSCQCLMHTDKHKHTHARTHARTKEDSYARRTRLTRAIEPWKKTKSSLILSRSFSSCDGDSESGAAIA